MSVIESHLLDAKTAKETLQLILDQGLDAWLYTEKDWLIRDAKAPHVARETWTVKFDAKVVTAFTDEQLKDAVKIVGVSDDHDKVASCEKLAQQKLGDRASAARSQPYYLDVTHPQANKGTVVLTLAKLQNIQPRRDRHHRRHAERRADVQQERPFDRDGQFQRRGEVAGDRSHRQQSGRGIRQGGAEIHSAGGKIAGVKCVPRMQCITAHFAAWCAADPGSSRLGGSRLCEAAFHAASRPGQRAQ